MMTVGVSIRTESTTMLGTAVSAFMRRLRAFSVANGAVTLVGVAEFLVFPFSKMHSVSLNHGKNTPYLFGIVAPVYITALFRILFFLALITLSTLSKEEIKVGPKGTEPRSKYPSFHENIKILGLIVFFSVPLEVAHIFSAHFFQFSSEETFPLFQQINASSCCRHTNENENECMPHVFGNVNYYMTDLFHFHGLSNGPEPTVNSNPLTESESESISCESNPLYSCVDNDVRNLGLNSVSGEASTVVFLAVVMFLVFVVKSFIVEVVFDFFHYWVHRFFHENKILYRLVHKDHHKFLHPTPMSTFSAHPVETLLSNTIPFFLALSLAPVRLSQLELHVFLAYKSFVEIAGHAGIETNSTSFPQGNVIPKILNIEMRTNDHDNHHTRVHQPCNYAKRFTLWDKVFGTYYSD
uniref:Fatty acid hydroxylase domain-containing protein n=1 Tax=Aplanochytrium stocchinoi TaxID=215587 RepID=A0A6S8A6P0_9STRA|mmetsp:Transcript_35521/g.43914  ORF Transcript_35521/g.43914 Transcript_35521/m.43914 type:complete len:410 (-) Transcript_35521:1140-2369(-)